MCYFPAGRDLVAELGLTKEVDQAMDIVKEMKDALDKLHVLRRKMNGADRQELGAVIVRLEEIHEELKQASDDSTTIN